MPEAGAGARSGVPRAVGDRKVLPDRQDRPRGAKRQVKRGVAESGVKGEKGTAQMEPARGRVPSEKENAEEY